MTAPDQTFPTTASNYSSLAAWAAKTQADWEGDLTGAETTRWNKTLDGFFGGLESGQTYTLTLLTTLSKNLLGLDPTTFFADVEHALESLYNWAQTVWEKSTEQWAAIQTQIAALITLLGAGPVPAAAWATWWHNFLVAIGVGDTDATNIGNFLSGNYDAAIKAKAAWDDFWAGLGVSSTGTAAAGVVTTHGSMINQITDIFDGLVVTPINTAVQNVKDWWNNLWSPQVTTVTGHTTTIAANADAVTQAVTGTSLTGANAAAVKTAVAGLQQTVAGLQNQVGGLQAPSGSPSTILTDDGRTSPGSGLGSFWTASGSGTVNRDATNGFTWALSGSSPRTRLGIYNPAPLATADQVGQIILNTMMAVDPFNSNPENAGSPYNQIILRANSTTPTSYVFARIRANHVQFGYAASGVEHLLGSPTQVATSSAAGYTFYAGDATSDYHYSMRLNGRVVATYDDSSAMLSSASIAGRYAGQSWTSDAYAYGGEANPAYTSWRAWDASSSAGTPTTFGHIARASATGATMTSGLLPYTFFDTPVTLGSGLSLPTSGSAGIIVSQAGLYSCSYALRMSSTSNATDIVPGISVNGALVETGATFMYDGGGTLLSGGDFGMASCGILCNSGDVIQPSQWVYTFTGNGLTGANGSTWNGDSSLVRSFFKINKVG